MVFRLPSSGTEQQETIAAPSDENGSKHDALKGHAATPDQHNSGGGSGVAGGISGQLCLVVVALLWGTYSPALKFLYAMDGPPTPAALTTARCCIQAASLLFVLGILRLRQGPDTSRKTGRDMEHGTAGGEHASQHRHSAPSALSRTTSMRRSVQTTPAKQQQDAQQPASPSKFKGPLAPVRNFMRSSSDSVLIAGFEMGLWNFGAAVFQAVGLEHTTATRSAFLIQATALLTPLLAMLGGDKPGRNVWVGCCIALTGTLLITADKHGAPGAEQAASMLGGDLAIFAAALFFSLATVRLGRYTPYFQPTTLAAAKSTAMAGLSLGWLAVAAATVVAQPAALSTLWPSAGHPQAWTAVFWAALGPGALAAWLQTKGQSTVPAAQSQVIFSSMPLWSALFAYLLLSGEVMGPQGWVGGALIVFAGLVARRK